jgi:hypothetical protein
MSTKLRRRYEFGIPVTNIDKTGGLFSVRNAGQLWLTCRALIPPEIERLPEDQPEGVKITIESVKWQEVDILPLVQQAEWKAIGVSLTRAAYSNLISILND